MASISIQTPAQAHHFLDRYFTPNIFIYIRLVQWVGLGLWGRCVSYVRENCVSYARQQISYHMHAKTAYYMHAKHVHIIYTPKSIFAYQYHEVSFLFGILFIRIFMRPGSILHMHMHMLIWDRSFLLLPGLCFWSALSRIIQEMRNSAP